VHSIIRNEFVARCVPANLRRVRPYEILDWFTNKKDPRDYCKVPFVSTSDKSFAVGTDGMAIVEIARDQFPEKMTNDPAFSRPSVGNLVATTSLHAVRLNDEPLQTSHFCIYSNGMPSKERRRPLRARLAAGFTDGSHFDVEPISKVERLPGFSGWYRLGTFAKTNVYCDAIIGVFEFGRVLVAPLQLYDGIDQNTHKRIPARTQSIDDIQITYDDFMQSFVDWSGANAFRNVDDVLLRAYANSPIIGSEFAMMCARFYPKKGRIETIQETLKAAL